MICKVCQIQKTENEFYIAEGSRRDSTCKICRNIKNKIAFNSNREKNLLKHREATRRYREINSKKDKESKDKYKAEHSERVKSSRSKWRNENQEHIKQHRRKKYYEDVEKSRMESRLWKHNNSLRYRELKRENYKTNPNIKKQNLQRKSLLKDLTKEIIEQVYERNKLFNNGVLTCYLCGRHIRNDHNLEHKTPLSRGGTNDISNLDVAHADCNRRKGTRTWEEYMLQEGVCVFS